MFALLLFLVLGTQSMHAELTLSVSQGQFAAYTIAILPFQGEDIALMDVSSIIRANLKESVYFKPISKNNHIQESVSIPETPVFSWWKSQRTQYVLTGSIRLQGDMFVIQYNLWDTYSGFLSLQSTMRVSSTEWRRAAHIISDQIHKHIVGFDSCYDTQIAFIHEKHSKGKASKQLAIMDQDGRNIRVLTPVASRVMTPIFSPSTNVLAFTSFTKTLPKVYFLDLVSGDVTFIKSFPGMTYAPRFSPDGQLLIFSGSTHAESNIYTFNIKTQKVMRLTHNNNVETSPCYSPDSKFIVFTSGTTSQPHLFIMDADGKNRRQLTKQKGGYSAPDWSPDGALIAFTKQYAGEFYMGVIKPDGTGERLLTKGFSVEGPRWSPNGQHIVFCRQSRAKPNFPNPSKICVIDVTGHNERVIKTVEQGSDPTWSPLLPTRPKKEQACV